MLFFFCLLVGGIPAALSNVILKKITFLQGGGILAAAPILAVSAAAPLEERGGAVARRRSQGNVPRPQGRHESNARVLSREVAHADPALEYSACEQGGKKQDGTEVKLQGEARGRRGCENRSASAHVQAEDQHL